MNMEKIYVNENCVLTISTKANEYVLRKNDKDIYTTSDKNIVIKLMKSIADNEKHSENEIYKPKNDIVTIFKPSNLEKNLLLPGKIEKASKKYNTVMNRIKDKQLLNNIPEDIKHDIEKLGIKESEILMLLEESKKRDFSVDFYEFLRISINEMKEKMGLEELNKRINTGQIDCKTNTITTMRYNKSNSSKSKDNNELKVSKDAKVYYVSEVNDDISYLVLDDDTNLILAKEIVNDEKATEEDMMFKYEVIESEVYSLDDREDIIKNMKDKADDLASNEKFSNNSTTTKSSNGIGSIDDYFNNFTSLIDEYKDYNKPDKEDQLFSNDDVFPGSFLNNDISDYKFEKKVFVGKEKLPILLYSNEEVKIKDTTNMKYVDTVSEIVEFGDDDTVTIGYDKYDDNGEEYYLIFIINEGEEPQEICAYDNHRMANEFVTNIVNIIKTL